MTSKEKLKIYTFYSNFEPFKGLWQDSLPLSQKEGQKIVYCHSFENIIFLRNFTF